MTMLDGRQSPTGYTAGDLRNAASQGNGERVSVLLAAGVNPNALSEELSQWGPLHYAALGGHSGVIRRLLDSGARLDSSDLRGETPIRQAAHWGNEEPKAVLEAEYERRGLPVGELPLSVVMDDGTWESKGRAPICLGEKHYACLLCSAPEFGIDRQAVMTELFSLCDKLSWLTFGYDYCDLHNNRPKTAETSAIRVS
jgi:hypothetical protein